MFRLKQSDTFTWPVTVMVPGDHGKHVKETFDAEFRRVAQSDLGELWRRVNVGEIDGQAFVREIVSGWKGVTDGDSVVPFSEHALDQLLEITGTTQAIINCYGEALAGLARKN